MCKWEKKAEAIDGHEYEFNKKWEVFIDPHCDDVVQSWVEE